MLRHTIRALRASVALITATWLLAYASPAVSGWQTFDTGDGLPSDWVNNIFEDRNGAYWVATEGGGVGRYDGKSWKSFTAPQFPFVVHYTHVFFQDRSGILWFGGYNGLVRYDGATWRWFTTADGLPSGYRVSSIMEDRAGRIWIGTYDSGIGTYDGSAWHWTTTANGLSDNRVYGLLQDHTGDIWVATLSGLCRLRGTTWLIYTTSSGLSSNAINSITEDRDGHLWCTHSHLNRAAVSFYNGSAWRPFGLTGEYVGTCMADRDGSVWFGSYDHGVFRWDGSTWRNYTVSDGLASNEIRRIMQDRAGNIWFATRTGGVSRYDGFSWRAFTTASGLGSTIITDMLHDPFGNLWCATRGGGVSRYDGSTWQTFTTADGLAGDLVNSILLDHAGNYWFGAGIGGGTGCGATRYDGLTWRTFTKADSLASDTGVRYIFQTRDDDLWFGLQYGWGSTRFDGSWQTFGQTGNVSAMVEDRNGLLWFATDGGVRRYDGSTWVTFLLRTMTFAALQDHAGNLWFGTQNGVSRYDGTSWRSYSSADGLPGAVVSICEDSSGVLWFGGGSGVTRFDGSTWATLTSADGLVENHVNDVVRDEQRDLTWFATNNGVSCLEHVDRVPPRTVILSAPAVTSPSPNQTAAFIAAFGETRVEFATRLDGGAWSSWSSIGAWIGSALPDGPHTLEIRSRDSWNNVEQQTAAASFVIDATPPQPVIASPGYGQVVRGNVAIQGTTADSRFKNCLVQVRPTGATSWNPPQSTLLVQSGTAVTGGALASWNTGSFPDGTYDLRVSVSDSLGLTGNAQVTLVVDNHPPYFDETAPAKVIAAAGGDIYTLNAETHLYFPPHAFTEDVLVTIAAADDASVPDQLASGALKVQDGFEISWAGALKKPARLTLSFAGSTPPSGVLAVYRSVDGSDWERRGGTVDAAAKSISLAVELPGRYALFADNGVSGGGSSLSPIVFTPRVFSSTGAFADSRVGISFRLGKPAPVTVKVFSMSGRLIREVAVGVPLNAGENIIT